MKLNIVENKLVLFFFILTTFVAFIFNLLTQANLIQNPFSRTHQDYTIQSEIKKLFPEADKFKLHSTPVEYYSIYKTRKLIGYVFLTTDVTPEFSRGYTADIKTLIGIDDNNKIRNLTILEHYETPQYVSEDKLRNFLVQFKGKSLTDKLSLGEDIDAMTGATITSSAIVKSVRESMNKFSQLVLNNSLSLKMHLLTPSTSSIIEIVLITVLFALSAYNLLCLYTQRRGRYLRYILLVTSILFLGFYKKTFLSTLNIVSSITGRFPALPEGLLYFFFIVFVLLTVIFFGRTYCGWLCPFGAIEEFIYGRKLLNLTHACRGVAGTWQRWRGSEGAGGSLRNTKYYLLWIVVILVFVFDNPNIANCEPFGTLFNLTGNTLFVSLVVVSLVGSIFYYRFYCRYFCPAGAFLGLCSYLSIFKLKLSAEKCTACGKCLKVCKSDAIELTFFLDGKKKVSPVRNLFDSCTTLKKSEISNGVSKEKPMLNERYQINIRECIQCNECVVICPSRAIARGVR